MDGTDRDGAKVQFTNLDGVVQPPYTPPPRKWTCARVCSVALGTTYMVLLTAVAVIAFILGCYSTAKVRTLIEPAAVLVTDPRAAPGSGYSVFSLGTGLGYWSPVTDMEFARSDHGVIAYGKYAYLVGGQGADGSILKRLVRYDTETGEMKDLKDMLWPRYRFAYALLNDKIYVMGGMDSNATDAGPLDTVMVYDIKGNNWTLTGQLNTKRVDATGAAVNNKVYVFGGYDASFVSLATIEELDPLSATPTAAPTWTLLGNTSNLITSRGDARAVTLDGSIYVAGGVEYYINPNKSCEGDFWIYCYRFLKSVEKFNATTKTWSAVANMINPRGDFGIDALPNGRIIVAGGERGNGTHTQMAMYDVEEYIAADDVWVAKAPLPQARFRDDLAYASGRVYAFGGTPTCGLDSTAACYQVALKTVFAYTDVEYPRLYAFYKPSDGSTQVGASSVGSSSNRRLL